MKAISTGEYKTTVLAPKGATEQQLREKAKLYIKGKFIIKP